MAKPSRVRYSGVAPFVDDTQANRVQALGSSSRLQTDDIKELGTLNIVEIVDDVPVVDVSIDQNENGTLDLFGLFSNKGYGCQVIAVPQSGSSTSIGSNQIQVLPGTYFAGNGTGNRIFFSGSTVTVPSGSTVVYLKADASGQASNQVAVGASAPAGSIQIATLSGGAVGSGNIRQQDITDARPTSMSQVTHLDFEFAKVDIFVPVRQLTNSNTINRTMYMENVYCNNVDLSFQVNGVATSNFRLETDNKRWFLNNSANIIVDNFLATGAQPTVTLSQTPNQLNNGNYTLKLIKNGTVLTEGTDYTVSGKTVTFTTSLASGDIVKVRYCNAGNGQFFQPVPAVQNPHPQLAGGLREGMIEVYLSDQPNNKLFRVQSARVTLPLQREVLYELGEMFPYDRPLQYPVKLNATIELKDSDLEFIARMAGVSFSTANEVALYDYIKTLGLTIKIYRETDVIRHQLPVGHPSKYAIKQYSITNLIPQNENWDIRVESDATQTFEFEAYDLTVTDVWSQGSIA